MFRFDRILVPIDSGEVSHAAVDAACELAHRSGGEVFLLHVLPPAAVLPPLELAPVPVTVSERINRLQQELEQLPESTSFRSVIADRQICDGVPATAIATFVEKHDIDVIVMGTHSRSEIKHLLLGSVTESVVRRAKCPVLTVPAAVVEYTSAEAN